MALFLVKLLFDFYSAKATAIRTGRREIDVFFGFAKLVLWEENEGLLFLKNKRIDSLVFGPDDGGGMKFIYPFFGEEIKVHVPLTLQLCEFQDRKVLTRESIQLFVKVAIWWRIKDRKGLEKFYLLISKEIDVINDSGLTQHRDYSNGASQRLPVARRVEPKKAELYAAQQWLLNLAESSIRKIISKTSVASVISNRASQYLHASHNVNPSNQSPLKTDFQLMATSADNAATPDSLGLELKDALTPVVMNYGLDIERIEVQEIQLPGDIQEAIDRVWKASLLPAQSAQESAARYNHIKAELDAVKDVIGVDAAAIDHVMKNFKGANFVGGFPRILEQLMTNSAPTLVKGIPSKKQPKKAE